MKIKTYGFLIICFISLISYVVLIAEKNIQKSKSIQENIKTMNEIDASELR